MGAGRVGEIELDLVVNQGQFQRQMKGITSLAKKAGLAIAGAFAVTKIVEFGKRAIELGSDLTEVQNVVDVTFTSMSKQVDQFAQGAAQRFGLSETMAKKYVGTFGAMSKAFGFSEQQAYDMSTSLTGLAGDVASFYNISQDEAYTKLKSVFTGETETLKDLGVVMTQSALDSYALANGYGKVTSKMSEAEKVALRFKFVQDQLSLANGDFSRTSDQWANQVRILKLQMESFMATVGQGLINVFTPVLKIINALIGKLIELANVFKDFTGAVSGKNSASAGMQQAADSAAATAGGMEAAGDAAVDAAGKAKKAGKQSLASFDKINVLKEATASGGNIAGLDFGTGGKVAEVAAAEKEMSPLAEKIQELLKPLKEISFDNLVKSLKNLKEAFAPLTKALGAGLSWIYYNVLVPLAKWTIELLLPHFLNLVAAALEVLGALIEAFKPAFLWLWEHFLEPIAAWTGGVIISALGLLAEALKQVAKWIQKNKELVVGITAVLAAFFAAWKVVKLMSFIAQAGGVVNALNLMSKGFIRATAAKIKDGLETAYLHLLYAGDFLRGIKNVIVAKAKEAVAWAATTAAKIKDKAESLAIKAVELVKYIGGIIAAKAQEAAAWTIATAAKIRDKAEMLAIKAIDLVKYIASVIAIKAQEALAWIKTTALKVADKVATVALTAATGLYTAAVKISTIATKAFSLALTFLAENPIVLVIAAIAALIAGIVLLVTHWDAVKEKAVGAWDAIKTAWGKVSGWFADKIVNPVRSQMEGLVNCIITGINFAIKALNKLSVKVPDFMGGGQIGFNIKEIPKIHIPRLATGAVIPPNQEFLAMLGDQKRGTNIEAPLSTIEQALRNVLAERGAGGGNGNVTVQMIVDGRELAKVTAPYNTGETNRIGTRLINGVI